MPKCVPVFDDDEYLLPYIVYLDCIVALADGDDFLLFWLNIVGFCVPSILLVSRLCLFSIKTLNLTDGQQFTACDIAVC